ncbi:phosphatase PAP2 family protein [Actinomyces sp. ZJ308]|uniref:phosphatase PAP2 family protein n=1 Tax=Actinomyces sp. ZJ308 TaxID=2708342 RepID=UPI00141E5A53|nr:phosphatase PAP2 family protein [Actinomyces sp. ZJ308]
MLSLDHLPDTWRTRRAGTLAVTAVITLSVFSWLALTTSAGTGLAPHDQSVTTWAVDGRHPTLTAIMQVFTSLGSTTGLTILTAICAALLFLRGHQVRALVLPLTMVGSSLLTVGLKEIFGRARPSTDTLLGSPALTTSFPSGHSFNTAVFAGLLAGMVLLSTATTLYRALAIMAAAGATLLVGASRVYLGYHWITDVLAGWSLGLAWLCLVALALLWLQGRRRPARLPADASSDALSGVHGIEPPST